MDTEDIMLDNAIPHLTYGFGLRPTVLYEFFIESNDILCHLVY